MLAIGRIIWSVRLIIINKICDFPFSPIEKARKEEGGRQGEKEKGQKKLLSTYSLLVCDKFYRYRR